MSGIGTQRSTPRRKARRARARWGCPRTTAAIPSFTSRWSRTSIGSSCPACRSPPTTRSRWSQCRRSRGSIEHGIDLRGTQQEDRRLARSGSGQHELLPVENQVSPVRWQQRKPVAAGQLAAEAELNQQAVQQARRHGRCMIGTRSRMTAGVHRRLPRPARPISTRPQVHLRWRKIPDDPVAQDAVVHSHRRR